MNLSLVGRGHMKNSRVIQKVISRAVLICVSIITIIVPLLVVSSVFAAPVGTSTTTYIVADQNQRKAFYANGRHWLFWADGANLVFDTSLNGVAWTGAPTSLGTLRAKEAEFSDIYIDSTTSKLYLAINHDAVDLRFRQGTAEADGTITWDAVEQVAVNAASSFPSIGVDSGGVVYIAYQLNGDTKGYVTRNDNLDGTWSTTAGFPYKLSDTLNQSRFALRPIGSNMLCMYAPLGAVIKAALYTNGAGWGAEETATTSTGAFWSTTTINNVTYVTLRTGGGSTIYVTRTAAGVWSGETQIVAAERVVLVISDETEDVGWFVYRSGHETNATDIVYKRIINGTVDALATTWFAQGAVPAVWSLTSSPLVNGNVLSFGAGEDAAPDTSNYYWLERPTITTGVASAISMDAAGVTAVTFNPNLTDMGEAATVGVTTRYGLASGTTWPTYTLTTTETACVGVGAIAQAGANNLTPGQTYYYRGWADGWGKGAESSFSLTMPTPVTGSVSHVGWTGATTTAKIYGNITSMGVASSTYYHFEWGNTPALGNSTTTRTATTTGQVSETITGFHQDGDVFYRLVVTVGAVSSNGDTEDFAMQSDPAGFGHWLLYWALPILIALGCIVAGVKTGGIPGLVMCIVGILAFVIVRAFFGG